jgi:hypothetical protein
LKTTLVKPLGQMDIEARGRKPAPREHYCRAGSRPVRDEHCYGGCYADHDPEKASDSIQGSYNACAFRSGSCPKDAYPDDRSP